MTARPLIDGQPPQSDVTGPPVGGRPTPSDAIARPPFGGRPAPSDATGERLIGARPAQSDAIAGSRIDGRAEQSDTIAGPLIDGRPARSGALGRLGRRFQRLLVSRAEREEAVLEQRIRSLPGVSRPNMVALLSPKGGVGKTALTFVVGTLLATHLKLRTIAVDASPEFGTLARLAPRNRRSDCGADDLLRAADRLHTAAELRPYLSSLPSGLHLLGAPRRRPAPRGPDGNGEVVPPSSATLGPDAYGELVAFLSCFYDVVLLDLATGMVGPLARFAVERADQVVLVTTPEWVTSTVVTGALHDLHHHRGRTTLAVNRAADDTLAIPDDERLAAALDSGTYALDAVPRPTRVAIKRLGLAVAERLV